jgi:hypothetical protein
VPDVLVKPACYIAALRLSPFARGCDRQGAKCRTSTPRLESEQPQPNYWDLFCSGRACSVSQRSVLSELQWWLGLTLSNVYRASEEDEDEDEDDDEDDDEDQNKDDDEDQDKDDDEDQNKDDDEDQNKDDDEDQDKDDDEDQNKDDDEDQNKDDDEDQNKDDDEDQNKDDDEDQNKDDDEDKNKGKDKDKGEELPKKSLRRANKGPSRELSRRCDFDPVLWELDPTGNILQMWRRRARRIVRERPLYVLIWWRCCRQRRRQRSFVRQWPRWRAKFTLTVSCVAEDESSVDIMCRRFC